MGGTFLGKWEKLHQGLYIDITRDERNTLELKKDKQITQHSL
jgi:hypothetical protein